MITVAKIKDALKYMFVLVDDGVQLHHLSPGVTMFQAYDSVEKRMKRYKAIDKGDRVTVEPY